MNFQGYGRSLAAALAIVLLGGCHKNEAQQPTSQASTPTDDSSAILETGMRARRPDYLVCWVSPGSPAEAAGVRVGDRLSYSPDGVWDGALAPKLDSSGKVVLGLIHADGTRFTATIVAKRVTEEEEHRLNVDLWAEDQAAGRIMEGYDITRGPQLCFTLPNPGHSSSMEVCTLQVEGFPGPVYAAMDANGVTGFPIGDTAEEEAARNGYVASAKAFAFGIGQGRSQIEAASGGQRRPIPCTAPLTLLATPGAGQVAPFLQTPQKKLAILLSRPSRLATGPMAITYDQLPYPSILDPRGTVSFNNTPFPGRGQAEVDYVLPIARIMVADWPIILAQAIQEAGLNGQKLNRAAQDAGIVLGGTPSTTASMASAVPSSVAPQTSGASVAGSAWVGIVFDVASIPIPRVSACFKGSPAVGVFAQGDVVLAVQGQPVHSQQEAVAAFRRHQPGDRVDILVRRGVANVILRITLGSLPESLAGH